MHSHDLQAQHDAKDIAARLDTTCRHLRESHVRRGKELAQEQHRYSQNPQPYKSLKHVDKVLGETGHRGIKAVRLQDGTVTNDPKVVLEEVLNTFWRQHTEDGELSAYTEELISHLPKLYNRTQRRDMDRTPSTIRERDEVLYKLQPGKTPGVDGLPAELYRRLPLNLKRHLAARLWDLAIWKRDVRGAGSGCPPSTGGDTWSDTPCRGGWTPRAAPATTCPTWPTPPLAPPPTAPKSGSGKHG